MKVKEESEKVGLKLNIQKTKIMASGLIQFSSVDQSCPTLSDPMNHSTPGFPVHHQFPEFTQTHVHWVGDAFQPSHPLLSPSPPALNLSQHQGLFKDPLPVPLLHGKQMEKLWKQWQTLFWGAPKSLQMVTAAMKLKDTCSFEEKLLST